MKFRYLSLAFALLVVICMAPVKESRADTVLYNSGGFIQGQQSFVQSFDITSAGTLTVSLSNIPWLDTISGLNLLLTNSTGALGSSMGSGIESMSVAPGMIYAHLSGDANGLFGMGVYGLNITFSPSGVVPVPLPTSLILLLSGIGILLGWQRRSEPAQPA